MVQAVTVRAILDVAELEAFRPELEEAAAHDFWGLTWDQLVAGVADKRYIAVIMGLPGAQAASVWDIGQTRRGKALICRAVGGTGLSIWLRELIEFAQRLAEDQGCQELVCYGRPGWEALLNGHGYVKRAVVMTKESW